MGMEKNSYELLIKNPFLIETNLMKFAAYFNYYEFLFLYFFDDLFHY